MMDDQSVYMLRHACVCFVCAIIGAEVALLTFVADLLSWPASLATLLYLGNAIAVVVVVDYTLHAVAGAAVDR